MIDIGIKPNDLVVIRQQKTAENGEMTNDLTLVGEVVKDVCYNNAINYFGIEA